MSRDSDYYDVLHVQPDAPTELIRASYRRLMQSLRAHPEPGGPNERSALVDQAYRVLSDPTRRAEYDRALAAGQATATSTAAPGSVRCLFCAFELPQDAADAPGAVCSRCRSPLTPATRYRLERSTRRMLRRTEREMPVRIRLDWQSGRTIDGQMRNLSLNGMLFEAAHEFEFNQLIRIESDLCLALARVSHSRTAADSQFATGVEFVTLQFEGSRGAFVSENA